MGTSFWFGASLVHFAHIVLLFRLKLLSSISLWSFYERVGFEKPNRRVWLFYKLFLAAVWFFFDIELNHDNLNIEENRSICSNGSANGAGGRFDSCLQQSDRQQNIPSFNLSAGTECCHLFVNLLLRLHHFIKLYVAMQTAAWEEWSDRYDLVSWLPVWVWWMSLTRDLNRTHQACFRGAGSNVETTPGLKQAAASLINKDELMHHFKHVQYHKYLLWGKKYCAGFGPKMSSFHLIKEKNKS